MKSFFKDYKELCKMSNDFYKKHWLGVMVVYAVTISGTYAVLMLNDAKLERQLGRELKELKKGETKGES